jgi:hypothetical protein
LRAGIGHPGLQVAPEPAIVQSSQAQLFDPIEVGRGGELEPAHAPEALERGVVQLQPSVRREHRHRVGELVERRLLDLDQRSELGLEPQLVGDVREHQQEAAPWLRLAHHLERPRVGQPPEVLGGREGLVCAELRRPPPPIVRALGRPAALAQPVEKLAVGRPLGQPRWFQPPELGEGGIVEMQAAVLAEDRHALADEVEGLVLGFGQPPQALRGGHRVGDVLGPDADASLHRRRGQAKGPPSPVGGDPAGRLASLAGARSLAGEFVGGAVEGEPPLARLADRLGADGFQPGQVRERDGAVVRDDPGGRVARVDERRQPLGPGERSGGRRRRREAQEGDRAGGAAFDLDVAAGTARIKAAWRASLFEI